MIRKNLGYYHLNEGLRNISRYQDHGLRAEVTFNALTRLIKFDSTGPDVH